MEVFISKTLTDSCISQDELVLINNALNEYDAIKKIKSPNNIN